MGERGKEQSNSNGERTGNSRGWQRWRYAARQVTSSPRHTSPSQLLYYSSRISSDPHRLPVAFTRTK
ncbi:hypothetical protein GW17_00027492 [Ensete ventricosum]|nr:hypothetical protein GW17_00027492 [Ensete ventricosum]RZR78680.1 hypothetical protein BHM03_00004101 [Ensete ventricosum]